MADPFLRNPGGAEAPLTESEYLTIPSSFSGTSYDAALAGRFGYALRQEENQNLRFDLCAPLTGTSLPNLTPEFRCYTRARKFPLLDFDEICSFQVQPQSGSDTIIITLSPEATFTIPVDAHEQEFVGGPIHAWIVRSGQNWAGRVNLASLSTTTLVPPQVTFWDIPRGEFVTAGLPSLFLPFNIRTEMLLGFGGETQAVAASGDILCLLDSVTYKITYGRVSTFGLRFAFTDAAKAAINPDWGPVILEWTFEDNQMSMITQWGNGESGCNPATGKPPIGDAYGSVAFFWIGNRGFTTAASLADHCSIDFDSVAPLLGGAGGFTIYTPTRLQPIAVSSLNFKIVGTVNAVPTVSLLNDISPNTTGPQAGCAECAGGGQLGFDFGDPHAQGFAGIVRGIEVSVYVVNGTDPAVTISATANGVTYSANVAVAGGGWYKAFFPRAGEGVNILIGNLTTLTCNFSCGSAFQIQSMVCQLWSDRDYTPVDTQTVVGVATGVYTGNGASQDIPVPFAPDWIWIRPATVQQPGMYYYDTMVIPHSWTLRTPMSQFFSPGNAGAAFFSVSGQDIGSNSDGRSYRWWAIRDGTKRLMYTGAFAQRDNTVQVNDTGSALLPTGFGDPILFWAHRERTFNNGVGAAWWRTQLSFATECSTLFDEGVATDALQSMISPSGFNTGNAINGREPQTAFVVYGTQFQQQCLWTVVHWVGDGTTSQVVPVLELLALGRPLAPGLVIAVPRGAGSSYTRDLSHINAQSTVLSSGSLTDFGIIDMGIGFITVGALLNVNARGYDAFIIGAPLDPAPGFPGVFTIDDDVPAPPPGCDGVRFAPIIGA